MVDTKKTHQARVEQVNGQFILAQEPYHLSLTPRGLLDEPIDNTPFLVKSLLQLIPAHTLIKDLSKKLKQTLDQSTQQFAIKTLIETIKYELNAKQESTTPEDHVISEDKTLISPQRVLSHKLRATDDLILQEMMIKIDEAITYSTKHLFKLQETQKNLVRHGEKIDLNQVEKIDKLSKKITDLDSVIDGLKCLKQMGDAAKEQFNPDITQEVKKGLINLIRQKIVDNKELAFAHTWGRAFIEKIRALFSTKYYVKNTFKDLYRLTTKVAPAEVAPGAPGSSITLPDKPTILKEEQNSDEESALEVHDDAIDDEASKPIEFTIDPADLLAQEEAEEELAQSRLSL